MMKNIYIKLLEEGTKVYRPVPAIKLKIIFTNCIVLKFMTPKMRLGNLHQALMYL